MRLVCPTHRIHIPDTSSKRTDTHTDVFSLFPISFGRCCWMGEKDLALLAGGDDDVTSSRPVPTFFSLFFYHSIFCVFTFLITQLLTPRLRCDRPVFDLDKSRIYAHTEIVCRLQEMSGQIWAESAVVFQGDAKFSARDVRPAPPGMGAVRRLISPLGV